MRLLALIFLLSTPAFAEYGKNKSVTVTTKGGVTVTKPSKEWAIVERDKLGSCPKPKTIVKFVPKVIHRVVEKKVKVSAKPKRNRFTLHLGAGYDGIDTEETEEGLLIKGELAPVIGGTYSRLVSERVSISASYMSNETATLGLGFDW